MGITSEVSYQMDEVLDSSEAKKKWVIAGISLRSRPLNLKPIFTKPAVVGIDDEEEDEKCSTTPTSEESRISSRLLKCPPAPKKRKPSSRCQHFNNGGVIEFFHPPDLETVFIRRAEKA